MSIVLPMAMLGATVLGGIGVYVGLIETDVKGTIQLSSGQRIYVGSEVRLDQSKKDGYPNSCLNKMGNGRVTSIDDVKRTVKFVCRKGGRAESEELPADVLDIVSSGINAVGISIPGGYLIEGSRVRLLQSARAKNRGKGLASPFANAVGVVTHLKPDRRTEVMVRTERLDNSKGSFEETYQVEDLEFVSGPSEPGKRGIQGGLINIGSTVQLKRGPDGNIDPEVKKKHANTLFGKGSQSYRLTGEKHNDAMGIVREWESFGTVTRILADPKTSRDMVTVRCVSKDASKSVVEEDYELNDLEAVPARSIPRPGIPIFGGMANNDIKVRLRAERKEAVASKPLGRAAFGDEGTVVDIQPEDKDNLQVLVVCNGKNPEELTKEWYEPEDLEIAEPEETEGEPVFGGRVTVGSMVRVRQSARGKKCLGTMEVGDVGAVKGIDPNGADNMKINVTCGRSMNAKKSEWYDPRDLELFFATEEVGTPLARAQAILFEAQRELNNVKSRQEAPTAASIAEQLRLENVVKEAQEKVDKLTGESVDSTKATEVYKNTKEKLESALKLKRDTEELRLKAAKETTCQQDPDRANMYRDKLKQIVNEWQGSMRVPPPDSAALGSLKPIQGSESFKNVWKTLSQHMRILGNLDIDVPTREAFLAVLNARVVLKTFVEDPLRSSEDGFTGLDDALKQLSEATVKYEKISTQGNQFKAAIETVERDVRKLEEVTSDLLASAYSGNTPTEKLLKRINDLKKEKEKERDDAATGTTKKLNDKSADYFTKLEEESVEWYKYRAAKDKYEYAFRNENTKTSNPPAAATGPTGATGAAPSATNNTETLLKKSITALKEYFTKRMDTLKAKKAEAIASAESACLEIALESISEMQQKVEKAVKGKCGVLDTAEKVMDDIDRLIGDRQRAFLAARIAIDPTMADPANAKFAEAVNGDYAGRIDLISAALDVTNKDPTTANFQKLVNLCGEYSDDKLLDRAKKFLANPASTDTGMDTPRKTLTSKGPRKSRNSKISGGGSDSDSEYDSESGSDSDDMEGGAGTPFSDRAKKAREVAERIQTKYPEMTSEPELAATPRRRVKVVKRGAPAPEPPLVPEPEFEAVNGDYVVPPNVPGKNWKYDVDVYDISLNKYVAAVVFSAKSSGSIVWQIPQLSEEYFRYRNFQEAIIQTARNYAISHGVPVLEPEPAPAPPSTYVPPKNVWTQDNPNNALLTPPVPVIPRSGPAPAPAPRISRQAAFREASPPPPPPAPVPAPEGAGVCETDFPELYAHFAKDSGSIENLLKNYPTNTLARVWKIDTKLPPKRRTITLELGGKPYNIQKVINSCNPANNPDDGVAELVVRTLSRFMPVEVVRPETVELKGSTNPRNRVRVIQTKLQAPVIRLAYRLANDQILRLKSRTSGRNVILQLAQDVTAEADRTIQSILDERAAFQFAVSKLNDVDVKVSGAVDFYETETAKLKTCISTRKASAIEQYDREIAELDKQKKELLTSKTFEVQKQQQGQPGNKDWSQRSIEDITREITSVKARLATPGISQSEREGKMKFLARLQGALAAKQAKTGGQRHRFTVRQPRRFHGY